MAVSSATGAPTPGSGGTNIDVNGIVNKLMAVEQKPLVALNAKEASYQAKISAFGKVKSALSELQSSLQGLNSAHKFQANVATSSNPGALTATALSSAAVGSHTININSLAQGQRLAAAGVASTTTPIGSGVLTFDFGSVSGDSFTPNVGKLRTSVLENAFISNKPVPAKPGTAISGEAQFTPAANSAGTIPEGTFTINGVSVEEIDLLDGESPKHRAANIAEAFDDAYVKSGGTPGTFTASNGVIIKAADGNKSATFSVTGLAPDLATGAANINRLAAQTGLSPAELGTQQSFGNSVVTVPSTVGLFVGDKISGDGFPEGTTVEEIIDASHFKASATGKDNTKDKEGVKLTTSSVSSSRSVAIEPSSASLEGIRDSINAAKIGVTASIVNDGSDSPNRLVLNSENIGSNTNMRITVSGDPALAKLLGHDPVGSQKLSEIAPAKDTSLTVDGIEVTKRTNTIKDVLPGVTMNLLRTGQVNLDIGRDTASVKTSVEGFVKSYNELKKVVTELTAYNPATKKGAPLQGDSAVRSLDSQIDRILSTPLNTPAGSMTTLSQLGISKQTDATLAIDAGKLNNAINTKFDEVAGLFAAEGKPTDSQVDFRATTAATKPGNYAITVSALATQGATTGKVDLNAGETAIAAGSKMNVTVDGIHAMVALTPGSYNGQELAKMLQEAINSTPAFASAGKSVNAIINRNGSLSVISDAYGSKSSVTLGDPNGKMTKTPDTGTPVASFMGQATNTRGTDVAGSINGQPATGAGQKLTSSAGDSTGLEVQITGGGLGSRGSINFTQGYAQKLYDFASSALSGSGLLTGRLEGLNSSVKGVSKERDALNSRLTSVEDRYRRQYTKLDATLSSMHETSTYLSQQLAKL